MGHMYSSAAVSCGTTQYASVDLVLTAMFNINAFYTNLYTSLDGLGDTIADLATNVRPLLIFKPSWLCLWCLMPLFH